MEETEKSPPGPYDAHGVDASAVLNDEMLQHEDEQMLVLDESSFLDVSLEEGHAANFDTSDLGKGGMTKSVDLLGRRQ